MDCAIEGGGVRAFRPDLVAKGNVKGETQRKVVILLDNETFEEVRGGAIANSCSFASQARMLIEVGLEELKLA